MNFKRCITILAAGVLAFAGCSDDQATDNITPPEGPQSRFRVANFINDEPAIAVNVIVEGVPYAANMAFGAAGATRLILTGDRSFRIVNTADESVVLFDETIALSEANTDYTIIFAGSSAEVQPIVMDDAEGGEPGDTEYLVRVVHGEPQAGAVDVYVLDPGADLTGATPVQANVAFGGSVSVLRSVGTASRLVFTAAGSSTPLAELEIPAPTAPQSRTYVLSGAPGGGEPYGVRSF